MEQLKHDVFRGMGIRIRLTRPDDFLKVKETLSRVGEAQTDQPSTLIQQCFILHKQGEYAILHYKELQVLDRLLREEDIDDRTLDVRDLTVSLLHEWGLLEPVDVVDRPSTMCGIKIVPFKQKSTWTLRAPYAIGKTKST